jgi:RND family efflux transporter MFP subunit
MPTISSLRYPLLKPGLLALLLGGLQPSFAEDTTASAQASVVRVATVRAHTPGESITLPARTAPSESARIFARIGGYVAKRHVDLGDSVKAGDALLTIDAPETEEALARARAEAKQAIAMTQLADVNLQRAKALIAKQFVSDTEIDRLQAERAVAEARQAAAEAEVARLTVLVSFTQITAPMDGIIVERFVERGDRVTADGASSSTGLLQVATLDPLRVEVDVPQDLSLSIEPGAPAEVAFPSLSIPAQSATVTQRAQWIDPQTGTMRMELTLPNPGSRLPAGLRGEARIALDSRAPRVIIPINALLTRQGRPEVALVIDGVLRFTPIEVDYVSNREVIVANGLRVGDMVIQSPNALLRDGDPVQMNPSGPLQ